MIKERISVLVIDNNDFLYTGYQTIMENKGITNFKICDTLRESFDMLIKQEVLVIVLNLNIQEEPGVSLLKEIKEINPHVPVIVISSNQDVKTAVECMKYGAFDFIMGFDEKLISKAVGFALEASPVLLKKNEGIKAVKRARIEHSEVFSRIITTNDAMKSIFRYIEAISKSSKAVLITGESGTGKELMAKAVHDIRCPQDSFVAVNVAGLDDTMFSDTLFGHRKGAFTGASENRKGLIEQASGGTLFLDEIGDLESSSQVKLLRLLQEGEYYPLGADVPAKAHVMIIASTNADLFYMQEKGTFRTDLYYRLNSHHIQLPPLRERLDDLPLLVEQFVDDSSRALGKKAPVIPGKLYTILRRYYFRGNIRELQSMIFDAVSRCTTAELDLTFFDSYIKDNSKENPRGTSSYIGGDCQVNYSGRFPSLEEVEDFFITEALKKAKGNQSIAAQLLGVAQSTISRRLRKKFG